MTSPEDIRQIVDALEQLDVFQWVKAQMAQGGPEPSVPPANMDAATPPVNTPPGAPPDMGAPPPAAAAAAPMPEMTGPAAPEQEVPEPMMAAKKPYMAGDEGNANATGEYQKVPPGGSDHEIKIGEPNPTASYGASEDQGAVADHVIKEGEPNPKVSYAAMKYEAADAMDDDELEEYMAQRKGGHRKYMGDDGCAKHMANYMAKGSVEDSQANMPTNGTAEPADAMKPTSPGTGGNDAGEAAEPYSRGTNGNGHATNEGIEQLKYSLNDLSRQLLEEKSKRIDLERFQKLTELRWDGLVIDPERELEMCRYMKDGKQFMSDEQFVANVDFMQRHGTRAPIDTQLIVPDSDPYAPGSGGPEKYSQQNSARAMQICEAAALKGVQHDYAAVLEDVRQGNAANYTQAQ